MVLDEDSLKFVFIATYFDASDDVLDNLPDNVKQHLASPTDEDRVRYLNYLSGMRLHGMVGEASPTVFKYVKPQFKFECLRDQDLDIIRHNNDVYLRKNTAVYATNLFVRDPVRQKWLMKVVRDALGERLRGVVVTDNYMVHDGCVGYMFAGAYLDWCGARVCSSGALGVDRTMLRLYLIGDEVLKVFADNDIPCPADGVLKNYYKGTPLITNHNYTITTKKMVTHNMNRVFESIHQELHSKSAFVRFIQRDYIFDAANFPVDLLEELAEHYVSTTALYKIVHRFHSGEPASVAHEVVVDRYGVDLYCKSLVFANETNVYPSMPSAHYLFIPDDYYQIRHTLNAAYAPKLGLVLLASHVFFGATKVLNFDPAKDLGTFVKTKHRLTNDPGSYFKIGGDYYLEETQINETGVPVFLVVRLDKNLLVRDNLSSHTLENLNNNWVKNTILNLFVHPLS
ncbi:49k [Spodoptera frugiperda granulovirus]|uniref:49k n=1 Tax=Spodoptera frugiperda granulovirus TaxID=307454 RepID=A0A068FPF5_9BBAC|nr:49k [Spodoptera frugiperda granulovirus]AID68449.1 p49 [Spodoptera frugiperda granulovirus]AJK91673.1 49k [Spodoptera frugiperda granulovirus]AXS01031.1 49k [Spodoptera frugiperda granulovirus]